MSSIQSPALKEVGKSNVIIDAVVGTVHVLLKYSAGQGLDPATVIQAASSCTVMHDGSKIDQKELKARTYLDDAHHAADIVLSGVDVGSGVVAIAKAIASQLPPEIAVLVVVEGNYRGQFEVDAKPGQVPSDLADLTTTFMQEVSKNLKDSFEGI